MGWWIATIAGLVCLSPLVLLLLLMVLKSTFSFVSLMLDYKGRPKEPPKS